MGLCRRNEGNSGATCSHPMVGRAGASLGRASVVSWGIPGMQVDSRESRDQPEMGGQCLLPPTLTPCPPRVFPLLPPALAWPQQLLSRSMHPSLPTSLWRSPSH